MYIEFMFIFKSLISLYSSKYMITRHEIQLFHVLTKHVNMLLNIFFNPL